MRPLPRLGRRLPNARDRQGVDGLRTVSGFSFTAEEMRLIQRAAAIEKKTRARWSADVLVSAAREVIRKRYDGDFPGESPGPEPASSEPR